MRKGWQAGELPSILNYLRSGHDANRWEPVPGQIHSDAYCGWSTCRFRCKQGDYNGSKDFTDGEWKWPEGLAHYIECHAVILPEEFVETMRSNGWQVPPETLYSQRRKTDFTFWLDWAARTGA
ncbi:MAG TPA: hypothetical protein VF773_07950 [Verrucomicrobiae bacterium]